MIIAEVV